MFRLTEPRDAEKHMQAFLDHGAVPVLSFKASCDNRVNASLSRPLQTVRTEHMCIATSILTRVVEEWGCVEELVRSTRGEQIKKSPEDVIDEYLIHHNVPGKLQLRWVDRMTSGGKLQEVGPREEPTGRSLRLWISRGFDGARFSRSLTAFANHEICTHAVRAINDRVQASKHRAKSATFNTSAMRKPRLILVGGTRKGMIHSMYHNQAQERNAWNPMPVRGRA